jgi:RNA polymerase sigma-70 factor (ECF subfamily)
MTPDEFSALYREHQTPIAKFLARRVDFADVEDLCSEVFEIAWNKRAECAVGFELPWLYRIAGFVVANARRRANTRNRFIASLSPADHAPSAEAIAMADMALAGAWGKLGLAERAMLALVAFEGLRVEEAATALGITANAASIRLHRARAKLAELLKD